MTARPRLPRPSPLVVDIVIAAIFVALTQWDVWVNEHVGGPPEISGPTLLLAAVSLAWRRRRPLLSCAGVMGGIAAQALLTANAPESLAVSGPALISVYSVAAYGQRRDALLGLALTGFALAIHDLNDPLLTSFIQWANEALFWWLVLLVGWVAGMFVNRSRRAGVLEEVAVRLERDRNQQAQAAAADERARVARELHDIVSHGVSLIALQAGAAQESLDEEPGRVRERLAAIEGTAREAAAELRRMLDVLRRDDEAAQRAPQPGLAEMGHLTEQLKVAGVDVSLEVHGTGDGLEAATELAAYRIVQEALTNSLKHAAPDHVRVVLRYSATQLEVEISDDGRRTVQPQSDGYGLIGMRERVALHGGQLETGGQPNGGYVVRARLPLTQR
ncbi:MAG TPA: histidine kinase [Solirubrobacteraceae bacterium]|nr:histidine kinase [Solirubrobacteraceae bacterium]